MSAGGGVGGGSVEAILAGGDVAGAQVPLVAGSGAVAGLAEPVVFGEPAGRVGGELHAEVVGPALRVDGGGGAVAAFPRVDGGLGQGEGDRDVPPGLVLLFPRLDEVGEELGERGGLGGHDAECRTVRFAGFPRRWGFLPYP